MTELIKLKEVHKYYEMGDNIVKALNGLDIDINKGDFVAIMGPSGSGKSTAMNLVGSLDTPTKGSIYLDKIDISHFKESELAQFRGKKIGFIFQSFNLIPNLTAKENIMLPMLFQNIRKEDRLEKAESLLKLVDLADREDHYPNQLSGGQQQRVAIARALANDPDIILADEPTGNLDTITGEKVMQFLQGLNKKGKTIIIITHEPNLAQKYTEKIYWLKDGKIEKVTKKVKGKWVIGK
ncbi:MAG: ABC transporter ATP-binding protein [Nanoarchaeota archaeon]|nr:ABC transporter ATP-binding protein [Nanoarchaeota archaeon]